MVWNPVFMTDLSFFSLLVLFCIAKHIQSIYVVWTKQVKYLENTLQWGKWIRKPNVATWYWGRFVNYSVTLRVTDENGTGVVHHSDITCPNGTKAINDVTCQVPKEYCGLQLSSNANEDSILPCPKTIAASPSAR